MVTDLERRIREMVAVEVAGAVMAERRRCAAACRAIEARINSPDDGGNPYDGRAEVAGECAEAIERWEDA